MMTVYGRRWTNEEHGADMPPRSCASEHSNLVDRHSHIGAIRRTAQVVVLVLKRHAARAGLDPQKAAGHLLQAGDATPPAAIGVSESVIVEQTGRGGKAMLKRHVSEGSLFRENAAGAVEL